MILCSISVSVRLLNCFGSVVCGRIIIVGESLKSSALVSMTLLDVRMIVRSSRFWSSRTLFGKSC